MIISWRGHLSNKMIFIEISMHELEAGARKKSPMILPQIGKMEALAVEVCVRKGVYYKVIN